ncbi:MAG TPA: Gfo/Idh/MocA family oxidoreductase [Nitrospiraceae bacterium]|nr:Gfo/Idh/MocA family oxidoreductase [Nitrospiraceae bacterium]
MRSKPRYVLVGTGSRGIEMFGQAIVGPYSGKAELAGICDINPLRMAAAQRRLATQAPAFTDFSACLDRLKPDRVIVATPDHTHHEYIVGAMRAGADVVSEKPLAICTEACRSILQTERETGRTCTVAFNYRHAPFHTRIKELLLANCIGRVISIDFHYYLDSRHGADYYRRWHRRKENSGGLLVHKATHHFDLINWWLEQDPVTVFARGDRQYYGPTRAERGTRCRVCPHADKCEFYLDLAAKPLMEDLYMAAESADGYYRDRCVFDTDIDIEDNMQVLIGYSQGTNLSYSLTAFLPIEGFTIAFNGSGGRLEAEETWGDHLGTSADDPFDRFGITLYPLGGRKQKIPIEPVLGGHAGGDERLLRMLFDDGAPDPMGHRASARAGAISILAGIAANQSIATGQAVSIPELGL